MRAMFIAIGNRLRRDDGVAHTVLESLAGSHDVESRYLLQLAPEIADDIAGYDLVVFLDSDAGALELSVETVDPSPAGRVFTHVAGPAEIVGLSRALFGFKGRAFLCRIPAYDFSSKEGLSRRAETRAREAAAQLEGLLDDLRDAAGGGNSFEEVPYARQSFSRLDPVRHGCPGSDSDLKTRDREVD
jgi:hydrogenase maturation protease